MEAIKKGSKVKSFFINNRIIFIAYGVAFLAMVLVYALYGVYPLGENHILQLDTTHAYAPRVNELLTKLRSGESFLYSWRGGLGNDFYMEFVTALFNPFIYVFFFFQPKNITEVFALVYLLQIPACAMTFAFFLKEKYSSNDAYTVMFSLMYAFCGYVTSYFTVYYWLPGVMMLPIIAVGIERLVKDNKILLYSISLGLGIISNYMIGVFLCFFSILYYLGLIFSDSGIIKPRQVFFSTLPRFIKGSLFSGALGIIVIVPASISFKYTAYADDASGLTVNLNSYFSFFKFLTAYFFDMTTTYLENGYEGLPNIYSGLLTFILLPIYFFNPKISLRKKLVNFCIFGVIYAFLSIVLLDFVIHVFHFPVGYPHRFTFIYIFFSLNIAFIGLKKLDELKIVRLITILISILIFSSLLFLLFPMLRVPKPGVFSVKAIQENYGLFGIFFTALIGLWLCGRSNKDIYKKGIMLLMLIVVFCELVANTVSNLSPYSEVPQRDLYIIEAYDDIVKLETYIDRETEFYRTEHYPNRVYSDGKLFNFNGVSMFSVSYAKSGEFLKKMGVHTSHNKIEYRLSTPLLNSIFSVKYSLNRAFFRDKGITFFEKIQTSNDVALYENPYALPIGFMMDDKAMQWNTKAKRNVFSFENDFVKNTSSISENLFSEPLLETGVTGRDLTFQKQDNGYLYTVDEDILPNTVPIISFEYEIKESGYHFLNLNGTNINHFRVKVGGKSGYSVTRGFVDGKGTDTFDVGYVEKGTGITVDMEIKNRLKKHDVEEFMISDLSILDRIRIFLTGGDIEEFEPQTGSADLYLCKMDERVFIDVYEEYIENPLIVSYYDDTTIKGTLTSNKDGVLFTSIPYDERWIIYVNGKQVNSINLFNAYIGIPIAEGIYDIELIYSYNIPIITFIISLFALLLLIGSECHKSLFSVVKKWRSNEKLT